MIATKVAYSFSVVLVGVALAGCGLEQVAAQQRAAELKQQAQAANADCNVKFPPGNAAIEVARVQCLNDAFAILMPTFGADQDLAQKFMADRMAIAERVQNSSITWAEGNAEIAAKWSEAVSESQRRNAVAQSVAAQQEAAAAADWQAFGQTVAAANQAYAASLAASQPVRLQTTCTRFGNTTTCY